MEDLYTRVLDVAISHYDVDQLVKLWYDSWYIPNGEQLRNMIMDSLPVFASHYGLTIRNETTFNEFVELYDDKANRYDDAEYKSLCKGLDDYKCMRMLAMNNDWNNIRVVIRKSTVDQELWDNGLLGAAEGGHLELVEFFIRRGATNFQQALAVAAGKGSIDIIEYIVSVVAEPDFRSIMYNAIYSDQLRVAEWCLDHGYNPDWQDVMRVAVGSRALRYVDYATQHGATNFDDVVSTVAADTILFFLRHGASINWNKVLEEGVRQIDIDRVRLALDNGASNARKMHLRIERVLRSKDPVRELDKNASIRIESFSYLLKVRKIKEIFELVGSHI